MAFELPQLPYAKDALAPYISAETLDFHWGKHHAAYVNRLNELTAGSSWASASLEEIVKKAGPGAIFNQAAQHWNHSFYWKSMKPGGGGSIPGVVEKALKEAFGDLNAFRKKFSEAAAGHFGSGWAWLVKAPDGSLQVEGTHDAGNPLVAGKVPLLTCDVWEHAYYIDYRNARAKYIEAWWNLVNWEFAAANLK